MNHKHETSRNLQISRLFVLFLSWQILILIITFHSPRRPQLRRRFGKLSVRTEENRDLKRTVKHVNSERTVTPLMIQYIISDK